MQQSLHDVNRLLENRPYQLQRNCGLAPGAKLSMNFARDRVGGRDIMGESCCVENPSPRPPPLQGEGEQDTMLFSSPPLRCGEGVGGRGFRHSRRMTDWWDRRHATFTAQKNRNVPCPVT